METCFFYRSILPAPKRMILIFPSPPAHPHRLLEVPMVSATAGRLTLCDENRALTTSHAVDPGVGVALFHRFRLLMIEGELIPLSVPVFFSDGWWWS